jgi:hypothetical protein
MAARQAGSLIPALALCLLLAALCDIEPAAASTGDSPVPTVPEPAQRSGSDFQGIGETEAAGVTMVLDEHLLTDPQRDMDYNGGGEITFRVPAPRFAGSIACWVVLTER